MTKLCKLKANLSFKFFLSATEPHLTSMQQESYLTLIATSGHKRCVFYAKPTISALIGDRQELHHVSVSLYAYDLLDWYVLPSWLY